MPGTWPGLWRLAGQQRVACRPARPHYNVKQAGGQSPSPRTFLEAGRFQEGQDSIPS